MDPKKLPQALRLYKQLQLTGKKIKEYTRNVKESSGKERDRWEQKLFAMKAKLDSTIEKIYDL